MMIKHKVMHRKSCERLEPIAVFHEDRSRLAEVRFVSGAFAKKARIRTGRRAVGGVAADFTCEIDRGVSSPLVGFLGFIDLEKAFVRST